MTWPRFVAPAAGLLFLLLIPLVLFYFLKLKRPRLDVGSLVLWRSVLNDERVNSPFQRFRRNLLLWLQIALLSCLVLAAMRPFLPSGTEQAEYLPVLIDCSASMAALDRAGGESRLEVARREVQRVIEGLLPGQRISLIAVGNTARSLCEFTDNRRVLLAALNELKVQPVPSQLEDGLRMAQALSLTAPVKKVLLFSDGNVPARVSFDLPFELVYQRLPASGPNVGITAATAQRARDQWDVFVRLEGTQGTSLTSTVEVWRDGTLAGSELVTFEGGASQRVVFPIEAQSQAALEVRLKPDGFDSLTIDNQAFLDLPVSHPLRVFCAPDLYAFRQALTGLEDVQVYPDEATQKTLPEYDLVITHTEADVRLPTAMLLTTGLLPEPLAALLKIEQGAAEVVDWQRSALLLQYVQLRDVIFSDEPQKLPGVEDSQIEQAGYDILAQGRVGPLVLRSERQGRVHGALLFHVERSTLVTKVGFPVLVRNALEEARRLVGLSEAAGQGTGLLNPRVLSPSTTYTVVAPDGTRQTAETSADGILSAVAAPQIGRYSIREGETEVASTGASLLSQLETGLEAVDTLQVKETKVGASIDKLPTERPLWPYLALAALAILLVEWWFFHRRPAALGTG